MLRAISALIRTPQNNLRIFQVKKKKNSFPKELFSCQVCYNKLIFKDGNLVFAEECQTELVPVLKRWFHLQDTTPTDQTLLVLFLSFFFFFF